MVTAEVSPAVTQAAATAPVVSTDISPDQLPALKQGKQSYTPDRRPELRSALRSAQSARAKPVSGRQVSRDFTYSLATADPPSCRAALQHW